MPGARGADPDGPCLELGLDPAVADGPQEELGLDPAVADGPRPMPGARGAGLDHAVVDGPWLGEISWRISTATMLPPLSA